MDFNELGLIQPLLQAVKEAGYQTPSPIQQKAIPPVLAGRDLLGCAQTGTGKTAAFALPILQLLNARPQGKPRRIRTLVLTPTRELALQIQESFEAYGRHLPLRSTVIFGGVGQGPQVEALRRGVDVLVATPGRLNDLIGQGHIKLDALEIFVLDEADRMLDMGFVNDVKKVIRQLPKKRQTLFFSATMPKEIVQLAAGLLTNPVKVFVTPPATTVERITQRLYHVDKADKRRLLPYLLNGEKVHSALVFTRTKHGADRVVRELKKEGVPALAIHGNKSQNARQNALSLFKNGKVKVLVATDIAARGLDISELSHVFNYDLPNIPDTYVHRIGRTGRAGHGGDAISFCSEDEREYLADIEKLIGFAVPCVQDHPWPAGKGLPPEGPAARQQEQKRQPPAKAPRQQKQAQQKQRQKPAAEPPPPPPAKTPGRGKAAAKGAEKPPAKAASQPRNKGRKADGPDEWANSTARRRQQNPYENRTGGHAIITKRPPWAGQPADAGPGQQANPGETKHEGEMDMARNNRRRRGGKNRGGQGTSGEAPQREAAAKKQPPPIKKNERGVFDFTEAELAEDTSLRLITDKASTETKYASFEDYLKDH